MVVYHGSDTAVPHPEIRKADRALDFGVGFYTTLNKVQAESFAAKVAERRHSSKGFLSIYEADIEAMKTTLYFKWFEKADGEWLDFVSNHRNGIGQDEGFDFVYGPVANDTIFKTFIAYQSGILSREETLDRLKVRKLYNQLVFASLKSLSFLSFVESVSFEVKP
jgi:hypothetical protein